LYENEAGVKSTHLGHTKDRIRKSIELIHGKGPTFVRVISKIYITELRACLEILDQAVDNYIRAKKGQDVIVLVPEKGVAKVEALENKI
jgi:hypothetical protein